MQSAISNVDAIGNKPFESQYYYLSVMSCVEPESDWLYHYLGRHLWLQRCFISIYCRLHVRIMGLRLAKARSLFFYGHSHSNAGEMMIFALVKTQNPASSFPATTQDSIEVTHYVSHTARCHRRSCHSSYICNIGSYCTTLRSTCQKSWDKKR